MSISSTLQERVRIERLVIADDSYGGKTQSWTELATVFAQVEPVYTIQGEREVADQHSSSSSYRVRIRTRTDVEASMRIIWKTHTLQIHSIHEQDEILSILTYEEKL